jgi:protein TonB
VKVQPIKMVSEIDAGLHAPTKIPKEIKMLKEDSAPPPQVAGVAGMSGMSGGSAGGVLGGVMGGVGAAPTPVVKVEKPKGPARVSSGVMAGQLLSQTKPTYPPIARAAHVAGAVVLHAMISKTGTVTNLQVISGPEMLRANALDAVRSWRYKPYLLNGEPTEVETTVTVNFNMGS